LNKNGIINLDLKNINLKKEYNTDDDDIISDLYAPCLLNSIKYDRAVGYFRANIYRELGEDLLNFVIKGGKIKIICSPDITETNENVVREGYESRGQKSIQEYNISLIKTLEIMSKNPEEEDCLNMLRLLIETESMELLIATRPGGIYHRKIARFVDPNNNKVIFSSSGNETRRALSSVKDWVNDEDFDVYRSWGDEFEREKARIKEKHLDNLISGESGRTRVRPLNQVEREYIAKFRSHNTFEECRPGAHMRTRKFITKKLKTITPYPYQLDAIKAWKKAGKNGMLSMATGTGKTYVSLFAVEEFVENGILIFIVVPTQILIEQWKKNISIIYPDVPILIAGGGYDWRNIKNKRMFISDLKLPKIILATMATASSDDFIKFIDQSKKKVLIADEAHRLGSPSYRSILKLNFIAKIGLSATPERLFDSEGNLALQEAFGNDPIYTLDIDSTVKIDDEKIVPILGHFLSKYNYYFYTVNLNYEEQKKWNELSDEIKKLYAILNSNNKGCGDNIKNKLKFLLIKRSIIVKKAVNKIKIVSDIIKERYPDEGHWIVYCQDENQLNSVLSKLRKEPNFHTILKYHSKMSDVDKKAVLDYFENNPSIIVSIRCLDEGVDIPKSDGAIILASSKNPRQYIQRRGRVLRTYKGKRYADIVDVLVEPNYDEGEIPFSIIRSEIARAWDFAQNSQNRDIIHNLWELCLKHKVEIDLDKHSALEEEGEEYE